MQMKMYFLKPEHLHMLEQLFLLRKDGLYYEISSVNGFVDIMQYSAKYKDVHLITVHRTQLDDSQCLGRTESSW